MSMNSVNIQEDLRVRRTRKLLWEALMSLMIEQDFEAISVKEICDRAMVHRTTFYKHYEDKYDFLRRGMREMHNDVSMQKKHIPCQALSLDVPPPSFVYVFEHIAKHEHFYRLILGEEGTRTYYTFLRRDIAEHVERGLQRQQQSGKVFLVPLALKAQFVAGALLATIAWWLENNQPCSPEQIAYYVKALFIDEGNLLDRSPGMPVLGSLM